MTHAQIRRSKRAAPIRYGVTTVPGPNDGGTDPYRIRRYAIGAEEPLARFAFLVHNTRAAVNSVTGVLRGG